MRSLSRLFAKLLGAVFTLLLLVSCTTVYEDGQKVLSTSSDVTNIEFQTKRGTKLKAGKLANSPIHKAVGAAVMENVTAAGVMAMTHGLVKP